jgi:glycosyltransferase involved in cell wall biosynthesis
LQKAFCLRALTEAEALQYRGFGFRGRIAVIPNGVDFPVRPSPELLLRRYPELQGKRVVLFLGRFHRKKGLDLLIPAWRTVASQSPDAHLLLAGPDSDGTLAEAKSAVAGHGLRSSVTFTGALNGDLKMSALACASGFVLPSRSEGFSAAVLEALASGVPAVITNNCNFHEVATHRCGWVVQQETKEIAAALRQLLDISPSEHESMRINACRLIASKFTWARVAQQMDQLYAWALGGNPPTLVQVL